jgi:hypothetical protein
MTWSARASSGSGMVRPSALAVFVLRANAIFCHLLHREVGRLIPLEDAAGVDANLAVSISNRGHLTIVKCRSRPSAVPETFLLQPLNLALVTLTKSAFALGVVQQSAGVWPLRFRRDDWCRGQEYGGHHGDGERLRDELASSHWVPLWPRAEPYHRGCVCASQQFLSVEDRSGSRAVNLRTSICFPVCPQKMG